MNLGMEILEILKKPNSSKYMKDFCKNKKYIEFIPEMLPMNDVGECKYHVVNSFDHTIYALETLEEVLNDNNFLPTHLRVNVNKNLNKEIEKSINKVDLLKLGLLFHDIGKPPAKRIDETGRVRFTNHEIIGADMVLEILSRFNLNEKSIKIVYNYVRYHMELLSMYKNNDMSKITLTKSFDILKDETIEVFLLGYADIVATRKLLHPDEDMGVIKTYMEYALTNYIYRYKDTN